MVSTSPLVYVSKPGLAVAILFPFPKFHKYCGLLPPTEVLVKLTAKGEQPTLGDNEKLAVGVETI